MPKHGIRFVGTAARKVQPEISNLLLENGEPLPYDYLVIASGPHLAFDEVTGLGPHGGYTPVCLQDGPCDTDGPGFIRQGKVEPFWEKYAMRLMGVQKLKGTL